MFYTNITKEDIVVKQRLLSTTIKPGESKFISVRKSENLNVKGLIANRRLKSGVDNGVKKEDEAQVEAPVEVQESSPAPEAVSEEVVEESSDKVVEEEETPVVEEEEVPAKKTRKRRSKNEDK